MKFITMSFSDQHTLVFTVQPARQFTVVTNAYPHPPHKLTICLLWKGIASDMIDATICVLHVGTVVGHWTCD